MVPYNNSSKLIQHAVSSVLTTDASSDGHSPGIRSLASHADDDDDNYVDQQLFFVTSYSDFDKLAHGPRGHAGKYTLRVYKFFANDGALVLLHINGEAANVINPAFSRWAWKSAWHYCASLYSNMSNIDNIVFQDFIHFLTLYTRAQKI